MTKILFYGETIKNSLHGVSVSNQLFLDCFGDVYDIQVIEECSSLSGYGRVGFSKIYNYVMALHAAYTESKNHSFDFFYSVLSLSALGATKSLLMLMCLKIASPNTKLVIHIHRGDLSSKVERSAILAFLFKLAIKLSYKTILISKIQTKYYNKSEFLGGKSYVYVANSIDAIECNKAEFHLGATNVGGYYLYLSNYIREKGIYDLLSAWSDLPNGFFLRCFGGETPDVSMKSLEVEFPINNIKYSKSIFDVEKFKVIGLSKALILPSWNEGSPLVILEAMALGIPVIASDVGFIREMVGDEYPFLFAPKDALAIKDIVLKFDSLSDLEQENLGAMLKLRFDREYSMARRESDYRAVFN